MALLARTMSIAPSIGFNLALIVLWLVASPVLWDLLVVVADEPGGARWLFVNGVLFWLAVRSVVRVRRMWRTASFVTNSSPRAAGQRPRGDRGGNVSLEQRARHEAAHATAAHGLGAEDVAADVIADARRGTGGQCTYRLPSSLGSPADLAWLRLIISMAGHHADLEGGFHNEGSMSDLQAALLEAAAVISTGTRPSGIECPLTTDALLAVARERVARLLADHAGFYDSVTARLLHQPHKVLHVSHLTQFSPLKSK